MKNIYVASDHGGFVVKKNLISFLQKKGYTLHDVGPFEFNPDDDYPDYAIPLARKVARQKDGRGVVICRNGQGVCIATNKIKGIRAVTGFSLKEARTTRKDDNANVLCIPADYLAEGVIKRMALAWLQTPFSKLVRHKRRLKKIMMVEK